jgi:hypothetical protein
MAIRFKANLLFSPFGCESLLIDSYSRLVTIFYIFYRTRGIFLFPPRVLFGAWTIFEKRRAWCKFGRKACVKPVFIGEWREEGEVLYDS